MAKKYRWAGENLLIASQTRAASCLDNNESSTILPGGIAAFHRIDFLTSEGIPLPETVPSKGGCAVCVWSSITHGTAHGCTWGSSELVWFDLIAVKRKQMDKQLCWTKSCFPYRLLFQEQQSLFFLSSMGWNAFSFSDPGSSPLNWDSYDDTIKNYLIPSTTSK